MLVRKSTLTAQAPRDFLKCGADAYSIADSMQLMGIRTSYARNMEIFGEGEPADRVLRGSVRSRKLLDDGRRQITGFHDVNTPAIY